MLVKYEHKIPSVLCKEMQFEQIINPMNFIRFIKKLCCSEKKLNNFFYHPLNLFFMFYNYNNHRPLTH